MVTSFSSKALRKINREKSLLNKSAGAIGYPQAKKMNLGPYHSTSTKINSKWIVDLT